MSKEFEYKNLIAFHPGTYVEELVNNLNITQSEFANRLGTSAKTVSKIINGEDRISRELASKLSKLSGISVKTWLNLQANYDAKVIEITENMSNDESKIARLIDISSLKKNKFIEEKRYKLEEKVVMLRKLLNWENIANLAEFNTSISYRRSENVNERSIINSNVMLELASNQARSVSSKPYNKKNLEKQLPLIKEMVTQQPNNFFQSLKVELQKAGIILIAMPAFQGAGLNGATKKFKDGSVLLTITDKNKDSDIFWFSLLHEIGHIYHEDFSSNFKDDEYEEKEQKANTFAANFLISESEYIKFIEKNDFTEYSICKFAKENNTLPGIVVGRLQNDRYIEYKDFYYLKEHYSITN